MKLFQLPRHTNYLPFPKRLKKYFQSYVLSSRPFQNDKETVFSKELARRTRPLNIVSNLRAAKFPTDREVGRLNRRNPSSKPRLINLSGNFLSRRGQQMSPFLRQ